VGQKSFWPRSTQRKSAKLVEKRKQERALLYWCETIEAADLIEFWTKLRGTKLDRESE